MPLETEIKAEALKLGFVVCGITHPARPDTYDDYRDWIAEGRQAGLDYLARPASLSAREDPVSLLPGCRSILCVGLPYPAPTQAAHCASSGRGTIAAYALLPDYHTVMSAKLKQLGARLSELAGRALSFRACVDSAPILEKDFARQAGLGWIGRNSLLNAPGSGSYLFLGELLTDQELAPDAALPGDPCQNCRLCVDACPTHALLPNRSVDACRCLSYHTIENRGRIPPELRPMMGERVFGCDTCQIICPLNQSLTAAANTAPLIAAQPGLLEDFSLSEAAWKAKYQRTPVLRIGFAGYRRNLAIAMANQRSDGAVQALQAALEEDLPADLRETFLWALARLNAPDVQSEV